MAPVAATRVAEAMEVVAREAVAKVEAAVGWAEAVALAEAKVAVVPWEVSAAVGSEEVVRAAVGLVVEEPVGE